VIFDLWDTLVDYDAVGGRKFQDQVAAVLERDPDEFAVRWHEERPQRESGPLRDYVLTLCSDGSVADEVVALRHASTRQMLRPRAGAVETLQELRARGLRLGLISICTDDVPEIWHETPFAGLFDSTVFSCAVGLRKPDPRIYLLACEELGVQPAEAMFVGDGANDELAGAERVGMQAVLIHRAGEDPPWEELRDWAGPRITSVPEVLSLLDE
jgi:putative hydrolase of the HAD superfamily